MAFGDPVVITTTSNTVPTFHLEDTTDRVFELERRVEELEKELHMLKAAIIGAINESER